MKRRQVRRSAKEKSEAEQLVVQLNAVALVFERKVGEEDHIFGSVTSSDIAQGLAAKVSPFDRRKVQLDEPLKSTGSFTFCEAAREVTAHQRDGEGRRNGCGPGLSGCCRAWRLRWRDHTRGVRR